jgi:hypothetical protein
MNRLTPIALLVAALLGPSLALAASIQLSPATVSVTTGHTFTVQVVATPSGSSLYTASAHVSFNPAILSVDGFSFASTWMPVTQSGYDSTDNTGGVLIKTAGFPGGFNAPTTIGTITFTAKAPGTATISAGSGSILLDQNSSNEVAGGQGAVAVTVTNAPATPAQTTTTQTTTTGNSATPTTGVTSATGNATNNAGQTASAASALTGTGTAQTASAASALSSVPQWLWWLLLVLVLLGLGYWAWRQYASDTK